MPSSKTPGSHSDRNPPPLSRGYLPESACFTQLSALPNTRSPFLKVLSSEYCLLHEASALPHLHWSQVSPLGMATAHAVSGRPSAQDCPGLTRARTREAGVGAAVGVGAHQLGAFASQQSLEGTQTSTRTDRMNHHLSSALPCTVTATTLPYPTWPCSCKLYQGARNTRNNPIISGEIRTFTRVCTLGRPRPKQWSAPSAYALYSSRTCKTASQCRQSAPLHDFIFRKQQQATEGQCWHRTWDYSSS